MHAYSDGSAFRFRAVSLFLLSPPEPRQSLTNSAAKDRAAGVSPQHLERGASQHDDLVAWHNFHPGLWQTPTDSKLNMEREA